MKLISAAILSISLMFCGGCATGDQQVGTLTKSRVMGLRIGTSKDAVLAALGRPEATNSKVTSSGTLEVWQYSKGTLVERVEGGAAAFSYGFQRQIAGGPGANVITLIFTNGYLSSIEGL